MSKLERAVGAFFTNNNRYITTKGNGFHSRTLKATFERANFNVSLTAVFIILGIDYLTQTSLNTLETKTLMEFGKNIAIASTLTGLRFSLEKLDNKLREEDEIDERSFFQRLRNKAIDTEGRDLSAINLSLDEIERLKLARKIGLGLPPVASSLCYALLTPLYGIDGLIIHSSAIFGNGLSYAHRFNKLIKGHTGQENGYVFCDEPPAKTEKSKSKSLLLGGVLSPS